MQAAAHKAYCLAHCRPCMVAMLVMMVLAIPAFAGGEKLMPTLTGTIILRNIDNNDRAQNMKTVVSLLDVSVADAGAVTMTSKDMLGPFAERIEYELEYDPRSIQSKHSYNISVSIYLRQPDGAYVRKYLSTQSFPVLTRGYSNHVDIEANNIN